MIRERSRRWLLNYGTVCVLCGAPAQLDCGLCRGCRDDLPGALHRCRCCALPLAGGAGLCGRCQRRRPPYDRVQAPFVYQAPVDALIQGAKYHRRLSDARSLGVLLADYLAGLEDDRPQVMIPVPLHVERLRARGYNQALEIARPVARSLGLAIDYRCCVRSKATSPQARLGGRERRRNMEGAFVLVRAPRARHVAIVDDVMTTGGTVAELAGVLRRAGIDRIDVWVCARAPFPD